MVMMTTKQHAHWSIHSGRGTSSSGTKVRSIPNGQKHHFPILSHTNEKNTDWYRCISVTSLLWRRWKINSCGQNSRYYYRLYCYCLAQCFSAISVVICILLLATGAHVTIKICGTLVLKHCNNLTFKTGFALQKEEENKSRLFQHHRHHHLSWHEKIMTCSNGQLRPCMSF